MAGPQGPAILLDAILRRRSAFASYFLANQSNRGRANRIFVRKVEWRAVFCRPDVRLASDQARTRRMLQRGVLSERAADQGWAEVPESWVALRMTLFFASQHVNSCESEETPCAEKQKEKPSPANSAQLAGLKTVILSK